MKKKQARKRKQRSGIIYKSIGSRPTHIGTDGSGGNAGTGVVHSTPPSWYGLNDLRPDVAGMYLILGHEGKAVGGRMIQTVYAPNEMIAHFEDMSGERIGLHCIKSVYGPIPEDKSNG